jgi:adenine specific DNA methylase Mod
MPTLSWIGKEKVVTHHQDVPFRVLAHKYGFADGKSSEKVTSAGNKIIHGDNLEALKSLLPEYENKVKCIYIDPPYNTGNEGWVYNDNVNDPKIKKWLNTVVGKGGEDLSRHDKWLCMMYPRLKLLQRMLSEDGFIFVSIDVFEFAHLKIMMDEIFGLQNFRNCIAVRRGVKNVQSQFDELQALSLGHEYIFLYSRTVSAKLPKLSKAHDEVKPGKWDTFWRGTDRPTMRYELLGVTPSKGQWRWEKGRAAKAVQNYKEYLEVHSKNCSIDDHFLGALTATNEKMDFVRLSSDGVVQYYVSPQSGKLANDQWMDLTLSGAYADFDTEKNVELIYRIVSWVCGEDKNAIVLDSFAGSGTTAHALLDLNVADQGNRNFVVVEMESYAETITAERVRRVINGYADKPGTGGGFDYYELGQPLFLPSGDLNESIPVEEIRSYVYYTETGLPIERKHHDNPHYCGTANSTAYYFYYDKNAPTCLDRKFLSKIKTKAEQYLIYADNCLLTESYMKKKNIIFKKIPRDITRF